MRLDDWSQCPHCKFPGLYSALAPFVTEGNGTFHFALSVEFSALIVEDVAGADCPMCNHPISTAAISMTKNPEAELKRLIDGVYEEEEESSGGGGGGGESKIPE